MLLIDGCRVEIAGVEQGCNHLTMSVCRSHMRAGNRNRRFQPHQFGHHLCARRTIGIFLRVRRDEFRIVALDRCRHYPLSTAVVDVLGIVTDCTLDAPLVMQPLDIGAFRNIGAGHGIIEIDEHFRRCQLRRSHRLPTKQTGLFRAVLPSNVSFRTSGYPAIPVVESRSV